MSELGLYILTHTETVTQGTFSHSQEILYATVPTFEFRFSSHFFFFNSLHFFQNPIEKCF